MEHSPEIVAQTQACFEKSLNEHGYAFQQSVIEAVQTLFDKKSGWLFMVSEFPVEVRGKGTRIDFVAQRFFQHDPHMRFQDKETTYMIAECKRANPAFANWCFAKSTHRHRDQFNEIDALVFEGLHLASESNDLNGAQSLNPRKRSGGCHRVVHDSSGNVYHIGVEVKSNAKGNTVSGDQGRDAIEQAASQVCLGLNGMVNFLSNNERLWEKKPPVTLLPVIFTTANLWVSDAKLDEADLETGDLEFSEHGFRNVPWLFYQYHLSPGIKHTIPPQTADYKSLSDVLHAEYVRTIPIVNSSGIELFLRNSTALDFRD